MYTTQTEVLGKLPKSKLDDALLDEDDEITTDEEKAEKREQVWNSIAEGAAMEIDGYLAQQYTVPFSDPVPALVKAASLIFVLETLFQRRGYYGDENLYTTQASGWRVKLDLIGKGKEPLQAGTTKAIHTITITSLPCRAGSRLNS